MNTIITDNSINTNDEKEDEIIIDYNIYEKYILDLSIPNDKRIELIKRYYTENKENTIEIISRISGMYHFSGTKILEKYLNDIALENDLSNFLKVEAIKGLLSFEEYEEDIYDEDDKEMKEIKKESNDSIKIRNEKRQNQSYELLNNVCFQLISDNELATPYKVEVISMLMKVSKYKEESSIYFKYIINNDEIDCDYRYKLILSLERKNIKDIKYHLSESLLTFIENENNLTMYRILSGQYLLQSFDLENKVKENIYKIILKFAESEEMEYNLRADASDLLLSLGSEEMKIIGREMIMKLGGKGKTISDNKQNVHVKEIEKSVLRILEILCYVPTLKINENQIDFEYVEEKIKQLIEKENDENKINISLNRIRMDRTLYSSLSMTLSVFMVKLWSYIQTHENKNEIEKRLLQELEDMTGTCTSGYITRFVNTLSGFGELSISISFEDQIISNFNGRLNAYARNIKDDESIFRTKKLDDVLNIYMKNDENIKLSLDEIKKSTFYINDAIEYFYEIVLDEMRLSSSDYKNRSAFLLFFRTYMSKIREEMFVEFTEYISEFEFDLYFRKALSHYDGIRDMI
uniref:Uncharacterized protein n=1 Tax=viral metagenome TaxID=1070528 RepID=A0A6C0E0E3_9ZZZZ